MTGTATTEATTAKPRKHWSGVAGCWCCYAHTIAEAFGLNYPELGK